MSNIDKNSNEDMLRALFKEVEDESDENHSDDCNSDDISAPPLISLIDENGTEHFFEELDVLLLNDKEYVALLPSSGEYFMGTGVELIILTRSYEDDEIYLDTIEDENEYIYIRNIFEDRLADIF